MSIRLCVLLLTARVRTQLVSTLAGKDLTRGSSDGAGTVAQFNGPAGITYLEAASVLLVTDLGGERLRRVALGGAVTTLAGDGTSAFADGVGTNARFSGPFGVCADTSESAIFVADINNHRIRKITPIGVVSTLAGDGFKDSSGNGRWRDGVGVSASLCYPSGAAFDSMSDSIVVADYCNNRIRKVSLNGVVTTLAGGAAGNFADGTGSGAFLLVCPFCPVTHTHETHTHTFLLPTPVFPKQNQHRRRLFRPARRSG
jgi:hypothetical protein